MGRGEKERIREDPDRYRTQSGFQDKRDTHHNSATEETGSRRAQEPGD